MPREFPEADLEAIALEMDQNARDWSAKKGELAASIAGKWTRKAAVLRAAIDAYRERIDAPPITRRQKFSALVESVTQHMTPPDRRSLAANDK